MLPIEFENRMKDLLGGESGRFLAEIESGVAVRSFRINEIKAKVEDCDKLALGVDGTRIAFPKGAFCTEEEHPGSLPCHHAGMIYMQDPSAMATVHAIKIPRGALVLDSCSAPGGKTTQLAAMTGEEGIVVANEYEAKRCRILLGNVERMGCRNTVVVNLDTSVLAEVYPEKFDVVLCDAPCSGEGMFRKNRQAIEEWSLDNVKMCAERQREILANVAKCVAPGGSLIYSTCTFSLEENEMNVRWFLETHSDFELIDVEDGLRAVTSDGICLDGCEIDMTKARRFYPHVSRGEGQFIAVMKREASPENSETVTSRRDKNKRKRSASDKRSREEVELLEAANSFLRENLCEGFENGVEYRLVALNNRAYLSRNIALPSYGVFSAGVCVGEINGRRFLPHHQLFSAFGASFKRRVMLSGSDPEIKLYIKGLEIGAAHAEEYEDKPDGWAAVFVDGCALGGGKISGGICKNHYPKGLREQ